MTGLALLTDAFNSLRVNRTLVALYVALVCVSELVIRFVLLLLPSGLSEEGASQTERLLATLLFIVHAAIMSAIQAVLFARLGKEIDRPLWKCGSDKEAFNRFFSSWLALNLGIVLLLRVQMLAAGMDQAGAILFLEFLLMFSFALFFPVGVSVMYAKIEHWRQAPGALRVLSAQLPLVSTVMFLGFAAYAYMFLMRILLADITFPVFPVTVISAPLALVDCLSFAAMWRICMVHRDAPPEEDLDFY